MEKNNVPPIVRINEYLKKELIFVVTMTRLPSLHEPIINMMKLIDDEVG